MDAKAKIEEIEKRRAARREASAAARDEQHATDLEAIDKLEEEHGDGVLARLNVDRFVPGQPTFIVMRTPTRAAYKRFQDQYAAATKGKGKVLDAHENLARTCWVYPADKAAQDAMLEVLPGIGHAISVHAQQLVEAQASDEGKG